MLLEKILKSLTNAGKNALLGFAVIASPCAMAQDSGWYVGGNVGESHARIDDARITGGLQGAGFGTTSISDDRNEFGFKVFGGYQFNRYFALEGGYFNMGKFSFKANTVPAGTLDGSLKLQGGDVDAIGLLPITKQFSLFGRVGLTYADATDSFNGTGAVHPLDPSPSKREFNYKLGLGAQYQITPSLALRAEVERYRIDDAVGNKGDIDLVSVGLLYRFGQKAQTIAAPAPEPVGPVAEAPESVVETPPPPPQQLTFSADSLFDFGQATIKPAGREALDRFAAQLRGNSFDTVRVTGHTDRIGSHAYNLDLSQRRAEAVKAELVESSGIPASKIEARGVDGADPVTTPGACPGNRATPKLIACLQPDRRVEVEVVATRP